MKCLTQTKIAQCHVMSRKYGIVMGRVLYTWGGHTKADIYIPHHSLWSIMTCHPSFVIMYSGSASTRQRSLSHAIASHVLTRVLWQCEQVPFTVTVYPKKYAHGFCFAVLCCGYTLTDFPISTRLTSLALWQSNDCPSASKATLMNMDKYFMWIHYERLRNHNKAKHNKTCAYFLGYTVATGVLQIEPMFLEMQMHPPRPNSILQRANNLFTTNTLDPL